MLNFGMRNHFFFDEILQNRIVFDEQFNNFLIFFQLDSGDRGLHSLIDDGGHFENEKV